MDRSLPETPTAVFLHGILGCRKNWGESYCLCIMCTIVVLQQCIPPDQTSILCVLKTHRILEYLCSCREVCNINSYYVIKHLKVLLS